VSRATSSSSASNTTSYTRPQQTEKVSIPENIEPIPSSPPEIIVTPEPQIVPSAPTVSPENVPAMSDIAADIKTSVSESGTGIQPVYIFSLLSLAVLLGAVQFWVRKKKN
ncbi:MAG: hypothetical protein Q8K26_02885, partial [Candidatus Gracilibacteria bacterium]|nr:hypothetical protein [Candidatus Gracilibacteria bacterium]